MAWCWMDTEGHRLAFLPPCHQPDVLSRFRRLCLLLRRCLRALPPGWLLRRCSEQAVLPLPYRLQSLHTVITETGRTQTLAEQTDFQSPVCRQRGYECVRSHCHRNHTCSHRPAELQQKLLCLCLPNPSTSPPQVLLNTDVS